MCVFVWNCCGWRSALLTLPSPPSAPSLIHKRPPPPSPPLPRGAASCFLSRLQPRLPPSACCHGNQLVTHRLCPQTAKNSIPVIRLFFFPLPNPPPMPLCHPAPLIISAGQIGNSFLFQPMCVVELTLWISSVLEDFYHLSVMISSVWLLVGIQSYISLALFFV